MKEVIEKFILLEKDIADEKGGFVLFALFEREDAPNKWDVVISAHWFGEDKKETLKFIVRKINLKLTPEERVMLSRVVLLDPTDNLVKNVNSTTCIEHGNAEFVDCVFNGIVIKHAHIVTSKRETTS